MKPFPWRAGMRAIDRRGNPWRVYADGFSGLRGQGEPAGYTADWLSVAELLGAMPDPNDGATRGAFLDAIREAWGEPLIYIQWSYTWKKWYPYRRGDTLGTGVEGDDRRFTLGGFDSEWDALMAAWEAAP